MTTWDTRLSWKAQVHPFRCLKGALPTAFHSLYCGSDVPDGCTSPPGSIKQREGRKVPAQVRFSLQTRSAPRKSRG